MSPLSPDKHRFTVHFDVNAHVFQLLSGLGKSHGVSPNDAARDILLAWMLQIEKEVGEVNPVKMVTEH